MPKNNARATDKLVVLVTCADIGQADRIGHALVGERLAACVNIQQSPVRSIYLWKGKVERVREFLLIVKSSRKRFPRLARRVRELHSYQVPEIIAMPIATGSRAYFDWMEESLRAPRADGAAHGRGRKLRRLPPSRYTSESA